MRALNSALLLIVAVAGIGASCDPTHDNAISALGPEAPGIPHGPLHRAGQPCITCHDGTLSDPPQFTVGGTVYVNANDKIAAEGAVVTLTSANGSSYSLTANSVGNFYATPDQYVPTYPVHVSILYQGTTVKMTTHIGRDGSCADCHFDPAGPTSAGHVFIPANGVTP